MRRIASAKRCGISAGGMAASRAAVKRLPFYRGRMPVAAQIAACIVAS
jgi:hypothetical protein